MGEESVSPLREPPVRGTESRNGAAVITLAGELDLYNAEEIRTALSRAIDEGAAPIVVDMAAVEFMDSTALGVLIEARSRMAHRPGFRLAAPGVEARRALELSGLDRHFIVHDTVAEALEAAP